MKIETNFELTQEQEYFMKEVMNQAAKNLIVTMKVLNIPNYMEITAVSEGEKYTLKIEKHPAKELLQDTKK